MKKDAVIPLETVAKKIIWVRGLKVMLDRDLAALYGVETKNLNKAVTRNLARFPDDFMFRLTKDEFNDLRFHFGTSRWGGTRKPPRVFTEQGVAMLSSVLRSKRAIQVNIAIMRTFVKLREMLSTRSKLAKGLEKLEKKSIEHDKKIQEIYLTIVKLMESSPPKPKQQIGFKPPKRKKRKK
jgi:hypothetical protein